MPLAFSISLSRPLPVYVPSRLARGIPRRRRNASEKQQATSTHRAEEVSRPQTPCSPKADPAMHRRDLDFISTLFMVEQQESETESSDEATTSDEFTSSDESVVEEDVRTVTAMGKPGKKNKNKNKNKKAERRGQGLP